MQKNSILGNSLPITLLQALMSMGERAMGRNTADELIGLLDEGLDLLVEIANTLQDILNKLAEEEKPDRKPRTYVRGAKRGTPK